MRGTKAKRIRREVYGDMADVRKFFRNTKTGQIRCSGLRDKYQQAKRDS